MVRTLACLGLLGFASGKVYFSETFGAGWEDRWVVSKWKKKEGTQGKWAAATGKWFKDAEDKGIQTAEDSKFFGISTSFDSFSNEGKELIIQYQAKYEKDIKCGGGYMKIGPKLENLKKFGDPTPYNIMFGPDKCGELPGRTHLIFNYKGKNVLKKVDLPFKQEEFGISYLYRMILKPDNTVRVEIDDEKIYEGSIKEDWDVLQRKEIPDPKDRKPKDWAEEAMIADPDDKKPDDWAEEKRIVDPDSSKPHDWEDEEDGIWEVPIIDNPAFKGEWTARKVSNPAYKGDWEAKKIANPDYADDDKVYSYADFGFLGFDLWQVKGGAIFDNIILTDDKAEADKFAKAWKELSEIEKAAKKEEEEAAKAAAAPAPSGGKEEEEEEDDDDDEEEETKKEL